MKTVFDKTQLKVQVWSQWTYTTSELFMFTEISEVKYL
jgi:hypothetical protein